MKYKIVITEKGTEKKTRGQDWERGVGKETDEDSGWGYTPEIVKSVSFERTIYTQEIDELDFIGVVCAINNIKEWENVKP